MSLPPELLALRQNIDRLDQLLLDVLAQRRRVVEQVAVIKKTHMLPAHDPAREAAIRQAMVAQAHTLGLPQALVNDVMDAVFRDSRGLAGSGV